MTPQPYRSPLIDNDGPRVEPGSVDVQHDAEPMGDFTIGEVRDAGSRFCVGGAGIGDSRTPAARIRQSLAPRRVAVNEVARLPMGERALLRRYFQGRRDVVALSVLAAIASGVAYEPRLVVAKPPVDPDHNPFD